MENVRKKNLHKSAHSLLSRRTKYNSHTKFKSLYECYKTVAQKMGEKLENKRVIKLLGPDLNEIFSLALQMDGLAEAGEKKRLKSNV